MYIILAIYESFMKILFTKILIAITFSQISFMCRKTNVYVVSDTKRRKLESAQKVIIIYNNGYFNSFFISPCINIYLSKQEGRRAETVLDKKERSSKGKVRDEQKELRREKKMGRKRVIIFSYYIQSSYTPKIRCILLSMLLM